MCIARKRIKTRFFLRIYRKILKTFPTKNLNDKRFMRNVLSIKMRCIQHGTVNVKIKRIKKTNFQIIYINIVVPYFQIQMYHSF